MGKVKSEEKVSKETDKGRAKRKKRKKDLDELRKNVLETKRNLDDKTQGFDDKGKKTGTKTMCNRLLPVNKKQAGFFANGSKGDEINRVSLPMAETNRARLQCDFQKLLDGNLKGKIPIPNGFGHSSKRPSGRPTDLDEPPPPGQNVVIDDPNKRDRSPVFGNQNRSKRKLSAVSQQAEKTNKKPALQVSKRELIVKNTKAVELVQKEEKFKRRLFEDDGSDFKPIDSLVEELRFSPSVESRATTESPPMPIVNDKDKSKNVVENTCLNFANMGWSPANRYEELCAVVCSENFEDCLHEISYVDPLKAARKALINLYNESCRQQLLRQKVRADEQNEKALSSPDSCIVLSGDDSDHAFQLEIRTSKPSSQHNSSLEMKNLNFRNCDANNLCQSEISGVSFEVEACNHFAVIDPKIRDKATRQMNTKPVEIVHWSADRSPPETDNIVNSLAVNYDPNASKIISGPDKRNFSTVGEKMKPVNLGSANTSVLNHVQNGREEFIIRYLENVNINFGKSVKQAKSMFLPENFVAPSEKNVQTRYIGDPLRRHENGSKFPDSFEKSVKHVPAILRRSVSNSKKGDDSGTSNSFIDQGIFSAASQRKSPTFTLTKFDRDQLTVSTTVKPHIPQEEFVICQKPLVPQEEFVISQKPLIPHFSESTTRLKTPIIAKATFKHSQQALKMKQNFINAKYRRNTRIAPYGATVDKKGNTEMAKNGKYQNEIWLTHKTSTGCYPLFSDNAGVVLNYRNLQSPQNLGEFRHQEKKLFFEDQVQRYPIFIPSQTVTSERAATRQDGQKILGLDEQNQQVLLQEGEPKVIIIPNPGSRNDDQVLYKQSVQLPAFQNGAHNIQKSCDLAFLSCPHNVQKIPEMVYAQNGGQATRILYQNVGQQIQGIRMPELVYQKGGQNVQKIQVPETVFQNAVQNIQPLQFPRIVYQNGIHEMRNIDGAEITFESESSNVAKNEQNCHRTFQNGGGQNGLQYCLIQNANLEMQSNLPRHIKLPDGRVAILVSENEAFQNVSNLPSTDNSVPVAKYRAAVYVGDKNGLNIIYDPLYPQVGYKRTQVEGNNSQVYQRVIQPVYNISDVYRRQVPTNYFPTSF